MFEIESKLYELPILVELQKEVENVQEGVTDGFKLWALVSSLEDAFETAKKAVKKTLISELERNDGKLEQDGKVFNVTSSGRYDYSKDGTWSNLSANIKRREDQLKAAYKAAVNGDMLATEDGEIIPVPEYKPSEKSIKITYKK